MKTKSIYVIFFSSPYLTGTMIKAITKNKYSHVAISLDKKLSKVYSFARYNKNNPLYAGFVQESLLRYNHKGMTAEIKICEIPIPQSDYEKLSNEIANIKSEEKEYIYNLYSAIFYVFNKKVNLDKSYTCVEFVIKILSQFATSLKLDQGKFYSILDLENIVDKYVIYEGLIDQMLITATWEDDHFLTKRNIVVRAGYLLKNNSRLTYRLLRKHNKGGKLDEKD